MIVEIALAQVRSVLADLPPALDWLTQAEQVRLAGLRTSARGDQFLAARWQLRMLLCASRGGLPRDWALSADEAAAPRAEREPALRLSLSHSGAWVACAACPSPVGLDVEAPARARDIAGLADLCCSAGERALFGAWPAADPVLFYQLWSAKEAWLKSRGEWLAPRRLQAIQVLPTGPALAMVTTWVSPGRTLALCAPVGASLRWWTPQPEGARYWRVEDLCSLASGLA